MASSKTKKKNGSVKSYVTADTPIGEIASNYIKPLEVMLSYGLHCIGCGVSAFETIGQGAASHGMDEQTVERLICDINKAIEMEVKENKERKKTNGKKEDGCGCSSDDQGKVVEMSPAAIEKLKEYMEKEGKVGWGIRLTAMKNDLGQYDYELDFEKKAGKEDEVVKIYGYGGLDLFFESRLHDIVKGIQIDYKKNAAGTETFTMKKHDGCCSR
ncbi:DUF1858 domain-containing protein [Candidatus Parvarchaeota archaeon]|nr:DUF1858 domain-containing protein [Candidatus Parvarchaeota archaeon]